MAASPDPFRAEVSDGPMAGRAVRGTAAMATSEAAKFVIQLGSTAALARLLAPEHFGAVAIATLVIGVLGILAELGFGAASLQKRDLDADTASLAFWINVTLGFAAAGIACLLAWIGSLVWAGTDNAWLIAGLSPILVLQAASAQHLALLRRQLRFRWLARITVAALVASATTSILGAGAGLSAWSLVAGLLASDATTMLLAWRATGWRPSRPDGHKLPSAYLKLGTAITIDKLMSFASRNADNAIIAAALGNAAVGLYTRAYALMMRPLQQADAAISGVLVPILARHSEDRQRLRTMIVRTQRCTFALVAPAIAVLATNADVVVRLLLGPQWSAAAPLFAVLCIVAIGSIAVRHAGWILYVTNQHRLIVRLAPIGTALAVASFLIGIQWGLQGLAVAFAIQNSVWNLWIALLPPVRDVVPVRELLHIMTPGVLGAAVCIAASAAITAPILSAVFGAAIAVAFPLAWPSVRTDILASIAHLLRIQPSVANRESPPPSPA